MFIRNVTIKKATLGGLTPPPPSWESKLDDTFWKEDGGAATFSWDDPNQWWEIVAGSNAARLAVLTYGAGWQVDYRPTHVRITYQNSVTFDLSIRDGFNDYIIEESNYVSGTIVPCNFGGSGIIEDLYRIYFGALGAYPDLTLEVTNIEFLEA